MRFHVPEEFTFAKLKLSDSLHFTVSFQSPIKHHVKERTTNVYTLRVYVISIFRLRATTKLLSAHESLKNIDLLTPAIRRTGFWYNRTTRCIDRVRIVSATLTIGLSWTLFDLSSTRDIKQSYECIAERYPLNVTRLNRGLSGFVRQRALNVRARV